MLRSVIESPYAGNVARNEAYARACLRSCLLRGEAPFASHLLFTQAGVLDDLDPGERDIGVRAGLELTRGFDVTRIYTDFGISRGMQFGIDAAIAAGRPVEYHQLSSTIVNEIKEKHP